MVHSRVWRWSDISLTELKNFLALYFLTGVTRKPNLAMYWDTRAVIATPFFNATMSRDRFQLILRFIHFSDNGQGNAADKLYKVRPVLDHLLKRFREHFTPARDISIDEGMMSWRGRLSFRVYNPQKPIKYGVKSYILCCSKTGYCFNMKPYVGEKSRLIPTVDYLLGGLRNKGHHLYMDNFYNSVKMADHLRLHGTHVCGTLRKHRGEPGVITRATVKKLKVGECISRHNGRVLITAWRDKRIVKVMSTVHQDKMVTVKQRQKGRSVPLDIQKPVAVAEYNKHMSGVDHLDQMIAYYPFNRKSFKWSKRFVMYLFSIALYNSFVLYKAATEGGKQVRYLDYLLSVVQAWGSLRVQREQVGAGGAEAGGAEADGEEAGGAEEGGSASGGAEAGDASAPPAAGPSQPPAAPREDPMDRLHVHLAGHELVKFPPTERKKAPQRRCRVCQRKGQRKDTRFYCKACNMPLCPVDCYRDYHTKKDFKKK